MILLLYNNKYKNDDEGLFTFLACIFSIKYSRHLHNQSDSNKALTFN